MKRMTGWLIFFIVAAIGTAIVLLAGPSTTYEEMQKREDDYATRMIGLFDRR